MRVLVTAGKSSLIFHWADRAKRGAAPVPVPRHGLTVADALACQWGVESLGDAGKAVWVELRR